MVLSQILWTLLSPETINPSHVGTMSFNDTLHHCRHTHMHIDNRSNIYFSLTHISSKLLCIASKTIFLVATKFFFFKYSLKKKHPLDLWNTFWKKAATVKREVTQVWLIASSCFPTVFDLIRRTILMYKLISCPALKLINPERLLSTSFRAQETWFHHLSISCFGSALWFHLLLCARSVFERRNYKKDTLPVWHTWHLSLWFSTGFTSRPRF